jgi:hypothetical protein
MVFYNNSALGNVSKGYFFGSNLSTVQTFRNNLNYNNGLWGDEISTASGTVSHNSWNLGVTVNSSDFVSLDTSQLDGARNPITFELPVITYGKLVAGSDLIDAGTTIGVGSAGNDLGAFQYSVSAPPSTTPISGKRFIKKGRIFHFKYQ